MSDWPGDPIVLDDQDTYVDDEPIIGSRVAWWSWVAPVSPVALEFSLLDVDPDDEDVTSEAALGIFTGGSVDTLTLVVQGAAGDPVVLAAPASGTTYYIKASLPDGAPDEEFQLAAGPPADDDSYEMELEVLSGPLRAAPTAVVVTVDGGLPLDDVEFKVDGVLTGDEAALDQTGSLDPTSINVADGYAKGEHIVSVHSKTSNLAGQGTFTLQRGPYISLQVVGLDAPPVEIPAANTSTGVRRWVLQDLMPGGLGSWVMPRNPSSMSAPEFQRTLSQAHTTANDGQYHLASVARAAVEWTFGGYVDTQLEQQKLEAYGELNRRFYVIDHRSRAWIVAFRALEIVPRKRQQDDDGFNDWAADYTVNALIYDQNWRSLT